MLPHAQSKPSCRYWRYRAACMVQTHPEKAAAFAQSVSANMRGGGVGRQHGSRPTNLRGAPSILSCVEM